MYPQFATLNFPKTGDTTHKLAHLVEIIATANKNPAHKETLTVITVRSQNVITIWF